jgi:DNA-binding transcriptional regulator YiaG
MPEGYSYEIRETAKDLYVTEGMTYDQVAERTGVSVSQLKRWGSDEGWTEARKEYREALSSIKRDTVRLRASLLRTALESGGDPQSVYAFTAVEKIFATRERSGSTDTPAPMPERIREITTPAEAVAALTEVVEIKLNRMLAQPETLQLAQIKDLKQTMELISQMKDKFDPDQEGDDKKRILDADAIKRIREQVNL